MADPAPVPHYLVFADDWGRHPSSCQHLFRQLLDCSEVYWVNTIGTRAPRFDLATLRRGLEKVRHWALGDRSRDDRPPGLHVRSPWMWPWFTTGLDRRLNGALLLHQLQRLTRALPAPPIAVTTLPIVADLVGRLPVARWAYYCVDDFTAWPGLDHEALRRMEEVLVRRADVVIAASDVLRARLAGMGRDAHLLTHGVDLGHWQGAAGDSADPPELAGLERPVMLFWGVIDRRMDTTWVKALAGGLSRGSVVLVGPRADADPELLRTPRVVCRPPVAYERLPALAHAADVLIMPYTDAAVTRAMQPLKLKEYLATGLPVVARDLPATRDWTDCLDLASTPEGFSQAVRARLETGTPPGQRRARERLAGEDWAAKARSLERWLVEEVPPPTERGGGHVWATRRDTRLQGTSGREGESPVVLDVRVVTGAGGGPDKTILNSPRFLNKAGYRMLCAYMRPPGDPGFDELRRKAERWQAPLRSVPDRGPWDVRVLAHLLHLCRRERVAIWHGHDYKSNLLGLLLARRWPMRLVTTVHGWVERTWRTPLYFAVDRLCLPYYEAVLCVSEDLRERCLAAGVRAGRCVLVENAIEESFTRRREARAAKAALGLNPDRLLIGAVGRLSPEKGLDRLIRATAQLVRAGLDVELLIAGEGRQEAELRALAAGLGCADRVRLLGYRSDTRELYEAMDVYALSSLREGLPNVVLEALAMEVAVVATRVAGVPHLVRDGENGLLVAPGSVEELAAALARLLADAGLRERLRRAGRRTVLAGYIFSARVQKLAALYDGLLGRNPKWEDET